MNNLYASNMNLTYRRHLFSWHVRIVELIPTFQKEEKRSPTTCQLSLAMCHLSPATCHLSSVTCHLTTFLCSFTWYESPRRFCDTSARDLVKYEVNKLNKIFVKINIFFVKQSKEYLQVFVQLCYKVTWICENKHRSTRISQFID